MTRSFLFTPDAEFDALFVWEYIADQASEAAADRFIAAIYDECEKLGRTPGMGHYREELLDRNYRFWSTHSYLIVYRWQRVPIEVIALVHGHRDLNAFFSRRAP